RKRIRQTEKANTANVARRSRVATMIKKFETAVTKSGPEQIAAAFKSAMSELAKAGRKGAISKGAAARKTSRLAAKTKKKSA
ncbi:MAG: 30S ribosomal protein S20, partial [Pseudomonadota bacterium]